MKNSVPKNISPEMAQWGKYGNFYIVVIIVVGIVHLDSDLGS